MTKKFGDKADATTSGAGTATVENGGLKREEGTGAAPAAEPTPNTDSTLANPIATGFTGAWSNRDRRVPRINLIHKTSKGELIEKFGIGSFALNQEVKLSDGKTAISVTALIALKDYQQSVPFGSDIKPDIQPTPEAVIAAGGSLDYKDVKSGKFYGPRAHIQFVFPMPEGIAPEAEAFFPYEFEGKSYGMGMLTVASSAFTSVGKELATLCNENKVMRKGMEYGTLNLTSESRKKGELDWKIPVIKYTGENPETLVAFYRSIL